MKIKLTEEAREIIENCLYTFASLVVMHNISERQRDVDQCLEMIIRELDNLKSSPIE